MTSKIDFEYKEWVTLQAVFCAIVLDIAMADNELADAEAKAWHSETDALAESACPMVRDLLVSGSGRCVDEDVIDKAAGTSLVSLLAEAGALLREKASVEEMEDYKRSLRSLAIAVAEADPGGDEGENKMLVTLNDLLWKW